MGIIAYELVLGKRPYLGRERKQIRDEMLAREAKIPSTYKLLSAQGIDFVNKVLDWVYVDDPEGSEKEVGV